MIPLSGESLGVPLYFEEGKSKVDIGHALMGSLEAK